MLFSVFAPGDTTQQHWQLLFLATCCYGPSTLDQPDVGSTRVLLREGPNTPPLAV